MWPACGPPAPIGYAARVNIVETVLVFAVIPLAIYGLVSLATLRRKSAASRCRPGQPWEYPPLWWSANPEGVGARDREDASADATGAAPSSRGGASGSW